MKNEIKLVQVPKIEHQIEKVGKEITERIEALNIENLIATEDSLQSLKTLRTDLNKELTDYETQRKTVKKAVAAPYMEMEAIYKVEISGKINDAITKLKDKISYVENKLKDEKKKELEIYFAELCESEKIDFLKFDDAKLNINLTNTVTKLKKEANAFVLKVADDLKLIELQEYSIEMLVEYKRTLNVSNTITTILKRKEAEKLAKIQAEQKEFDRRKSELRKLGMITNSILKTIELNPDIFIKEDLVEKLSKEEFAIELNKLKDRVEKSRADIEAKKPKVEAPISSPNFGDITAKPVQEVKKPAQIIQKPVEQLPQEEIETSDFRVKTTMAKLRLLAKFLEENQIEYESL